MRDEESERKKQDWLLFQFNSTNRSQWNYHLDMLQGLREWCRKGMVKMKVRKYLGIQIW